MSIDRKLLQPYSFSRKSNQAESVSLLGTWQNELGSVMTIEKVDGATFSGTYASSVSGGQGSVNGTLAGMVSGDAIAFTVNWAPTFSSVTGWNGLLLSDGSSVFIYSLWNLASTPDQPENFWESILAGADLFEQITPVR
jgi:hypothetical protein